MSVKSPVSTKYIISLILLSSVLIFAAIFINFLMSSKNSLQLLKNRSGLLLLSVVQNAENAIISYHELEYSISDKLLDNAYLIAKLDAQKELSNKELEEIARVNSIYHIALFDKRGNKEKGTISVQDQEGLNDIKDVLSPLLKGEQEEMLIGFQDSEQEQRIGFSAAVKRENGGVVLVDINEDFMLELRKLFGVGKLLKDMGKYKDVIYVVIQDRIGILAATPNITSVTSISNDIFLQKVMREHQANQRKIYFREVDFEGRKILEVVAHFHIDNEPYGIVRLGISLAPYRNIIKRSLLNILVTTSLLMFIDIIAIKFIFANINKNLAHIKSLEQQIEQQRRLSAMGELAAGLAHEIRNPLNAIGMIAQRFQLEFEPKREQEEYRKLTRTIRTEIKRLSEIIKQFLDFARSPKLRISSVSLAELLDETLKVLSAHLGSKHIKVIREYKEIPNIKGDRDQLKQAFINLFLNAAQAIESDGVIKIEAEHTKDNVVIRIADNGTGIPKEALSKIFDLYFTTKSEGNGLGLAIVHRIISAHNGSIEVESELGKGTVFIISFPQAIA